MMATDCTSRSKDVVKFAARKQVIDVCIVIYCANPVCNRSKSCSFAASEEEPGWKPGRAVSISTPCTKSKLKPCIEKQSATPKGSNTRKSKARQRLSATSQKKRECLDISKKVKVLQFAKKNPNLGSRKLADHFEIGKTQIQAILKNKEAIIDVYASNETPNHAKRKRSSKYSDLTQAVWDWYTMCRNSNILVSGSMLQEEATLIAEKLEISDFVASNGWLEKFKQKYSICNKTVAGEAGDLSKETMESWNERAREITTGGTCTMFGTWMRRVAFGVASLKKRQGKTVQRRGKSEAKTNMGIFCKCGRGEGRSCCYWQVPQSEML